jgi:hypothetical protein
MVYRFLDILLDLNERFFFYLYNISRHLITVDIAAGIQSHKQSTLITLLTFSSPWFPIEDKNYVGNVKLLPMI